MEVWTVWIKDCCDNAEFHLYSIHQTKQGAEETKGKLKALLPPGVDFCVEVWTLKD